MALALLAWAFAHLLGGSPFIAAFVGGLASAAIGRGLGEKVVEFTEAEGKILNYLVFFLVGIFAFSVLVGIGWTAVLYAVLSLTVIRMLPVALSLIGSRLSGTTVLFVGWFGPRGLASIVLVLIAMADGAAGSSFNTIRQVVILTVLLSVFAHGISANPLSDRYARYAATLKAETTGEQAGAGDGHPQQGSRNRQSAGDRCRGTSVRRMRTGTIPIFPASPLQP